MITEGKQQVWNEYQKDIADDNYFYVRSCIRQSFFPASETIFLKIMQKVLNKTVYEHPEHTTCTGIGYHADVVTFDTIMTIIARHFALMTESGYENLVPSCITSFGLYTEVLETWEHNPEIEDKIRWCLWKATGREFVKPKNLAHPCDIIYKFRNEVAQKAKFKLVNKNTGNPLKVVEHIGCHYAKMFPKKGVGGAEFPYVLQGMIEAWGGEIVDYPERRHCCGFGFRQYIVRANRGYSVANAKRKFDSMQPFKPDLIICNCPGCTMFLDKWQYTISEMEGITYDDQGNGIPVLTYEELAGLVLGYNPWDLGLQLHQVQSEALLDKIGVPYDNEKKYQSVNGKSMGMPSCPNVLGVKYQYVQ